FDRRLAWPKSTGVVGRCVDARRAVWTRDVLNDPIYELPPALREAIAGMGVRAVLATPLNVKSRVVGALVISYAVPRDFEEREIAVQQAFADQAALALENALLYASARDHVERLRATQAQLVQGAKLGAPARARRADARAPPQSAGALEHRGPPRIRRDAARDRRGFVPAPAGDPEPAPQRGAGDPRRSSAGRDHRAHRTRAHAGY